jgi:hypothetical protein
LPVPYALWSTWASVDLLDWIWWLWHSQSEKSQGATTLIRKVLISLIMQPSDHFIHQLTTLREEFIYAVYGGLINLKTKFLAQRRCFAREDEIRADDCEDSSKEYRLRTFTPPSLADSDDYSHHATIKCFALSTQLCPPTLFLTSIMNLYWVDYQCQRTVWSWPFEIWTPLKSVWTS